MTNEGNTNLFRTLIIKRNGFFFCFKMVMIVGNNGDKEQKMWVPTPGHFCVEGKGKKRLLTFH